MPDALAPSIVSLTSTLDKAPVGRRGPVTRPGARRAARPPVPAVGGSSIPASTAASPHCRCRSSSPRQTDGHGSGRRVQAAGGEHEPPSAMLPARPSTSNQPWSGAIRQRSRKQRHTDPIADSRATEPCRRNQWRYGQAQTTAAPGAVATTFVSRGTPHEIVPQHQRQPQREVQDKKEARLNQPMHARSSRRSVRPSRVLSPEAKPQRIKVTASS